MSEIQPEQGNEAQAPPLPPSVYVAEPEASNDPPVTTARRAMALVRDERIRAILRLLDSGPASPGEIRERLLIPSEATVHARLSALREVGALLRRTRRAMPLAVTYELTPESGRGLLGLCDTAAAWVNRRPSDPLDPRGVRASKALGALGDGWAGAILQQLACKPRSQTQLQRAIRSTSHYTFKGRISRLAASSVIAARESNGRGQPYELTDWGREGIATLAAAARWERAHVPELTTPVSVYDALGAALIALPLVSLPEEASGTCELVFEPDGRTNGAAPALMHAVFERGQLASYGPGHGPKADAWIRGSIEAWFSAVVDGRITAPKAGGERKLATAVLGELYRALFRPR